MLGKREGIILRTFVYTKQIMRNLRLNIGKCGMSCLCRFLYGIFYDLLMSVTMQPDGHVPKLLYIYVSIAYPFSYYVCELLQI